MVPKDYLDHWAGGEAGCLCFWDQERVSYKLEWVSDLSGSNWWGKCGTGCRTLTYMVKLSDALQIPYPHLRGQGHLEFDVQTLYSIVEL